MEEKPLPTHLASKELTSKIHKELKINAKRRGHLINKWAK